MIINSYLDPCLRSVESLEVEIKALGYLQSPETLRRRFLDHRIKTMMAASENYKKNSNISKKKSNLFEVSIRI